MHPADAETLAAVAAAARQRGARTLLVCGQTPADGLGWVDRLVRAAETVGLVVRGVAPDALLAPAPDEPATCATGCDLPPLSPVPATAFPSTLLG